MGARGLACCKGQWVALWQASFIIGTLAGVASGQLSRGVDAVGQNSSDSGVNGTLLLNAPPMNGSLGSGSSAYFTLDVSSCRNQSYVNVELWDTRRAGEAAGAPYARQAEPMLLLNVRGVLPLGVNSGDNSWTVNEGTLVDMPGYRLQRPYHLVSTAVQSNMSALFYAAIFNANTSQNLSFAVQASCSAQPACPQGCSGHGNCTASGMCSCRPGYGDVACNVALGRLPEANGAQQSLAPSAWAYFLLQVAEPQTAVLVELKRQRGDPVLFVKPVGAGFVRGGVPSVYDFPDFADRESFYGRLDTHAILRRDQRPGPLLVAVYNNDIEFQETALFTLQATLASGAAAGALCVQNCSYPQGVCGGDGPGGSRCYCAPGFAGATCSGELQRGAVGQEVSGRLEAGQWAYVAFQMFPLPPFSSLVVKLERAGGHAVLLAKRDSPPTLTDYKYRFTSVKPAGSAPVIFRLDVGGGSDATYIFGIFNMNYYVHEPCDWSLQFVVAAQSGLMMINPLMSIVLGVASSLFLCLALSVCRKLCQRAARRRRRARRRASSARPADLATELALAADTAGHLLAHGLPQETVAGFPTLVYGEGMFASKEDAHCAICLLDYAPGDTLRQLPGCQHLFHVACVDVWLRSHSTCPLCRTLLLPRRPALHHSEASHAAPVSEQAAQEEAAEAEGTRGGRESGEGVAEGGLPIGVADGRSGAQVEGGAVESTSSRSGDVYLHILDRGQPTDGGSDQRQSSAVGALPGENRT